MSGYTNIYQDKKENPTFCYRSGKMVYEETFYNGGLISSGWNAAGYPLNLLEKGSSRIDRRRFPEPYAFNIEIDGQSVDYNLEFISFDEEKEEDTIKSVLTLKSKIKPLLIKIHTLLDSTNMFTRFIEIENLSDTYLNLSRLSLIGGPMEVMELDKFTESKKLEDFYSLGYFRNDNWGREGEFTWEKLKPEVISIGTRFGRDRFRHPMVFLRNNLTGKIWFMQIGWSGGCRFNFDYNAQPDRNTTRLSYSAEIVSHNPMLVIRPKETFISPEIHIGHVFGDVDEAVNEMISHIRKSVLNMKEADPKELLIGCGMGAEHDMTVETSKSYIRQFAEMGGEVFIIDAGWACPPGKEACWSDFNGRNIPDKERYPYGIEEIRAYCHEYGLKFAMWVDIESIGKYCNLHDEKPEWFTVNPLKEKSDRYLDMSQPEVAEWAENELARIIAEYKLDLLRVDHNVDFTEYFGMRENEKGIYECVAMRHIQAVYRMYENLKKRFPDVIFENCAGGGGRTDLGMMKNFNHTWVSDWQCAPYSVIVTNGMTMALPPERVDRLFAGMGCHSYGSFDLQLRNCMLGHMSLNVVAPPDADVNHEQMEFIKHSVGIYKNFIRPILPKSKIYHHTPDLKKDEIAVIEITSENSEKGVIGVFSLAGNKGAKNIRFKGVDQSKEYKVYLDNENCSFIVSGRELKQQGLNIDITSSLSSELILYEAT